MNSTRNSIFSRSLCLLSFDVEDWFQVENLKSAIMRESWDSQESRVVANVRAILSILHEHGSSATFFTLGWIAERFPNLIHEIHEQGHEVACHGYGHQLVSKLTQSEFAEDLKKAKSILENITGKGVIGYRAPSFQIESWGLKILEEQGFKYDSSFFQTVMHDRYTKIESSGQSTPVFYLTDHFLEVQLSYLPVLGKPFPWSGGAYFRLLPYFLYKRGIKKILRDKSVFVFYLHPWEIDPGQPKIKNIKKSYQLRHYSGLSRAKSKLEKLVKDFKFSSINSGLKEMGLLA